MGAGRVSRALAAVLLLALGPVASADAPPHPLQPADRSSPRATLKRFLEAGDAITVFLAEHYLKDQTREGFQHLVALADDGVRCLDLHQVAPAVRQKIGRAAAISLYATLLRIPLPPLEEIPDAEQMAARKDAAARRWTIPDTEITLVRVESGPDAGDFLFSPETVARAEEFHRRTAGLPLLRPVPFDDIRGVGMTGGGWMVPYAWIRALPAWLRHPIAGQSAWKWIALAVLVAAWLLLIGAVSRQSRVGDGASPLRRALAGLALPALVLLSTPAFAWALLAQVNVTGQVGVFVEIAATGVSFLAAAWVSWRLAPVLAEAAVASPRIPSGSVDAHLIRLSARVLGIAGALAVVALGADRLGIPVYGIVAGISVGGLAVALAAQPTLENLIAGLNLFADKPIRIGDKCKLGETTGTVLAIGIRSTRIRNADRTVTTIPNSALARASIVNLSDRDRTPLKATVGLRYETTPAQLRQVLDGLNALLAGHPRVHEDGARARFAALGASSLDVEISAEIETASPREFAEVREELLLGILGVVEAAGTGLAFPSQTLYLGKDVPPGGGPGPRD
ncbi:MAG TPA: mechanosensitive ion channel family protein [Anaeromyxobacteraceae bacterium]|nr:mechanosensitive ion channel family protein [Anaeromyxobacteraceae bacterium]